MSGFALPAPRWRRHVKGLAAVPAVALLAFALFLIAGPARAAAITWGHCKAGKRRLECANVRVPLDWSRPQGRSIQLAVIRRPASRPTQRIGTLFVNFGGPGVAGVPTVERIGKRLDRLGRGRFDIVSWDPRGTGESTNFACFDNVREEARFWDGFAIPADRAEGEAMVRRTTRFAAGCVSRNRELVHYDSTADTARDLDRLRELLGEATLNYRGISYGTFIGQTYANLFPGRVRAMVLDGNIDPLTYTRSVQAATASGIAQTDTVIGKMLGLCGRAGPRLCALARGGSPERRFHQLVARLRRGPIDAPRADPPELTYSDLLLRIFTAEGSPAQWPTFAAELDQAARGDGSTMAAQVQGSMPAIFAALNSAVPLQCADKPAPPRLGPSAWPGVLGQLEDVSRYGGAVQTWLLWAPCAAWKIPAVHRYTGPWGAVTPNPVLVVGTRYDPRTAYRSSVIAARVLGNAVLLTHEGFGHTSDEDPSTCVEHRVAAYLIHLATPPAGTVCHSDHLPFSPDFGPPLG